ncbi:unnamed protein product, partial [Trichogramma brassicae]
MGHPRIRRNDYLLARGPPSLGISPVCLVDFFSCAKRKRQTTARSPPTSSTTPYSLSDYTGRLAQVPRDSNPRGYAWFDASLGSARSRRFVPLAYLRVPTLNSASKTLLTVTRVREEPRETGCAPKARVRLRVWRPPYA